jgi:hypothetical protein
MLSENRMNLHVKCRFLLSDFNQNWNMNKNCCFIDGRRLQSDTSMQQDADVVIILKIRNNKLIEIRSAILELLHANIQT